MASHPVARTTDEPTLPALATGFARRTVPSRLWLACQLALPWSVDLALRGWWRGAGWCLTLSLAGGWGLLDQWVWRRAPTGTPRRVGRLLRALAGGAAALLAAALLLEGFLRLMGSAPIS